MKDGFVRMACAVALILLVNGAMAQGYHQLNTDDFQGSPRPRMLGHVAYTNCTIHFTYVPNRYSNNYYSLKANVELTLNRDRSWLDNKNIKSKTMLDEILNHEQGHYAIAYMEQQELLRQINRTNFNNNYQAQAMALFNRIDAKYKQLNDNYDEDTRHMQDRLQQHSWDEYFKKQLIYMPPVAREGY